MEVKTIFKDHKSDLLSSINSIILAVSQSGVNEPAVGLVVILLIAIETAVSWPAFLLMVVLACMMQFIQCFSKRLPTALHANVILSSKPFVSIETTTDKASDDFALMITTSKTGFFVC